MLDAILTMIGYYVVILASAMILIVVGIQIFKMLSGRKQGEPSDTPAYAGEASEETSQELAAAAIAAVSVFVSSEERGVFSAWSPVERAPHSPWKIASKSRRISVVGG